MSSAYEKVLALGVQDSQRLGPLARPILLELVEVSTEGVVEAMYWIRCYRADEEGEPPGGWPFVAQCQEGLGPARAAVRRRWFEATLQDLPDEVFGEGVSA